MRTGQNQAAVESSGNASGCLPKALNRPAAAIAILVVVGALVYFNSLSNGFVFDDFAVIVENKSLNRPGFDFGSFFNRSYFKIAAGEASYRPMATLSYYIIHKAAGLNPFYYHLASVVLHILNTLLVYWTALLILKNPSAALIAGLLFACHPAQTEAVDCIAYNEDLLTCLFFLPAFIFYLKATPEDSAKTAFMFYAGSLVFFLLGLLSKEMAITLPAVLLLYDLTLRDRDRNSLSPAVILKTVKNRIGLYAGYAAVGMFYLMLRFVLLTGPAKEAKPYYGSLVERILYLPDHIFSFIKLAVFPLGLNAGYVFSYPSGFFSISNLVGFIAVVGLAAASIYIHKLSRQSFFCLWWFLITLFPVYNIIQIFNPFAERYLYIPLIGFCMLAAHIFDGQLLHRLSETGLARGLLLIVLIAWVGLYGALAAARNRDWKDSYTLWSKTVNQSPGSSVAHGSLGRAYQDRGQLVEAAREYEKALQIFPDDFKTHYNLGVIYDQQNRLEAAVRQYRKSIAINPAFADAHFNLANIYQRQGLPGNAIGQYQKVIELDPADIEARNNLGVAYAMEGELDKAVIEWERLLKIDPGNRSALDNIKKAKAVLEK